MRQKFHFWIRQTGKIGEERGNFHATVFKEGQEEAGEFFWFLLLHEDPLL